LCASTSSSSAAHVMAKLFSAQYLRLDATDRWPSLPSSSLWQATNTWASSFRGSGQAARDYRTVRSCIVIRRVFLVFAPVQHVIAEALRCVGLRGGRLGRFWRRDFRRTRLRGSRRFFDPSFHCGMIRQPVLEAQDDCGHHIECVLRTSSQLLKFLVATGQCLRR
jgi:hypothetical protein